MLHDVLDSDLANRRADIIPLYREASCTSRENLKLFFGGFSTKCLVEHQTPHLILK